MGGVDRADQLRAYLTAARMSQLWWRQLLFFLVDISRVNSWICNKTMKQRMSTDPKDGPVDHSDSEEEEEVETCKSPKPSHSMFTLEVAMGLIDGFAEGSTITRQHGGAQPVAKHNVRHIRKHYATPLTCFQCRGQEDGKWQGC
jgi:hypothetical protein